MLIPFLLFFAFSFLFFIKKGTHRLLPLFLSLALLLGLGVQTVYHESRHAPWRTADAGSTHTLLAEVEALDKATAGGAVYLVHAEELDKKHVNLRLLLKTGAEVEPFREGDRITATVTVSHYGNDYLYSEGIAGQAEAISAPERLATSETRGLISTLRKALSTRIEEGTSKEGSAFYSALLLGDRSALSDETVLAFRRSGISHLLALSGMHLTILALLLLRFLRLLRVPHAVRFLLLLLFLSLYAAIAGFPLSLLRAALMLTLTELGRLLRLLSDSVTSLFLSVALIMLVSPTAAMDVGLWLSFLATLGILTALDILPGTVLRRRIVGRLLHTLAFSLLCGLCAILFTTLLSTLIFGHISLVALPANLLLSPPVSLALAIGPFLLFFPAAIGPIAEWLSQRTLDGVRLASGVRGAYATASYPLFTVALVFFTLYLGILLVRSFKTRRGFLVRFFVATALLSGVFLSLYIPSETRAFLLISRADTDDYLVLREHRRVTVVANACTEDTSALLGHLEEQGITEIDTLLLTHLSERSADMLSSLSENLLVRTVILPGEGKDKDAEAELAALAEHLGIRWEIASGPTVSTNGQTIKLLMSRNSAHQTLFLSFERVQGRIVYTSPAALATVNAEAQNVFLEDASLLYLGAHPKEEGREGAFILPSDCRLLTAYPEALSQNLAEEAEAISPYGFYLMPLR